MAWNIPAALVTGNTVTETHWNQLRDSIIADSLDGYVLANSRSEAIKTGAGYQEAPNHSIYFEVPTTSHTGFVYKAIVEVRTENAATTITPRIWNVTDSTAAVTGTAGATTSWGTQQTLTFTVAAGKQYRLEVQMSDNNYQGFVIGIIRRAHA